MKPQTSLHGQSKCEDNYDGLRVFNWDRPAFLSNHCYTLTLLHTRTSNKTTIKVSKNENMYLLFMRANDIDYCNVLIWNK